MLSYLSPTLYASSLTLILSFCAVDPAPRPVPEPILSQLRSATLGGENHLSGLTNFDTICFVPEYKNTKDFLLEYEVEIEGSMWVSENRFALVLSSQSETYASQLPDGDLFMSITEGGCYALEDNRVAFEVFRVSNGNSLNLELSIRSRH